MTQRTLTARLHGIPTVISITEVTYSGIGGEEDIAQRMKKKRKSRERPVQWLNFIAGSKAEGIRMQKRKGKALDRIKPTIQNKYF
tara:strand:- start:294 stop:548 length:255 start_codon:yes stop_codon:yes gene_type:complete